MNSKFDLTIAVSSYNRDDNIEHTLRRLFESDLDGLSRIELIVIDDGSPKPVGSVIARLGTIPDKFELRLIEQDNSGIGATRNRGYREAKSDLVLFMDDDILVRKDTIKAVFQASSKYPGGVIFGSYPFVTHETKSLEKFAHDLYGYCEIPEAFEKVESITSGLLVVDKSRLCNLKDLYRNDLTIPAAEEFEIVARFHELGIPIFRTRCFSAIHNHDLKLKWLAEQQYKYGLGTAEAFAKYPEIVKLEKFAILKSKLEPKNGRNIRACLKRILASGAGRAGLMNAAGVIQFVFPSGNHNFVFGLLASAYFWAGYRDGIARFLPVSNTAIENV